ncbi:MerR family transcriptional regulator [Paenibacillus senegalimassiliensis]|uniref:MerR family transcriptional regulator n=1 Tax=Paenibacillus senegalimassiliensis TaxID=1737426 RepID=UPI00073F1759|nr:MerR family transcriptional regulator [Paenibacillus senegalimassiliensis]
MNEFFSIGEISNLFNIDVRLLRHYDKISLLKPEFVNQENGYRYYSTRQFEHLNTIHYLRSLNMPLPKIREFLEKRDDDKVIEILYEQKKQVEEQRIQLDRIERKIKNRIQQIEDAYQTEYDLIIERELEERRIAIVKKELPINDNLEHPIRELARHNSLHAAIFLGKVAASISKTNLEKGIFDTFSAVCVVIEPEDEIKGTFPSLPAGNYLTLRFRGTHKDAECYYVKMIQYMKQQGYQLAGDSLEFALIDYGLTKDSSKFTTEIQIPFKRS